MDFCVLNVLGYVCYTTYCANFYFNPNIIQEYKERMSAAGDDTTAQVTVQGNDVAFAIHAVIMATATLSQIGMYDGFTVRPPSRRVYVIVLLAFMYCSIYISGTWLLRGHIDFLGFLYVLGSKCFITCLAFMHSPSHIVVVALRYKNLCHNWEVCATGITESITKIYCGLECLECHFRFDWRCS